MSDNKKSSIVYAVQQPSIGRQGFTYDITPASVFGLIKYVFPSDFQPSLYPDEAIEMAEEKLADFDENSDFILWCGGDPAGAMVVGGVLANTLGIRTVKYLRWEKPRGVAISGIYDPRNLHLT